MAGRPKGQPKTGGRKKGSRNKVAADVRALANKYTAQALETLADVMVNGTSDAAKVAASNAILDRACGKPAQAIEHSGAIRTASLINLRGASDAAIAELEAALAASDED